MKQKQRTLYGIYPSPFRFSVGSIPGLALWSDGSGILVITIAEATDGFSCASTGGA
ncbi:hypothetical protein [Pseudomonas sp. ITA]|uniref:hypothetical protein n=1 Tax=Pseudomonas sp. ITA TaxID=2825841 RepID=UPI00249B0C8A|nr:hypothetical protein [Pseudomonas sp. ITA]